MYKHKLIKERHTSIQWGWSRNSERGMESSDHYIWPYIVSYIEPYSKPNTPISATFLKTKK